jgi:hypothetical protein
MPRKSGSACWEFLWRENDKNGNGIRRTAVIGTFRWIGLPETLIAALPVGKNGRAGYRQKFQSTAKF